MSPLHDGMLTSPWNTSHGSRVTRVMGGRCNCFLVTRGDHCLLVDSGRTNSWQRLQAALDALASTHGRPSLLVLTHTHFDHAENAARLQAERDLRILVHQAEASFLGAGDSPLPSGSVFPTRALMSLARDWAQRHYRYQPVTPDVVVEGTLDLSDLGFQGALLIPTPGHSRGSMSLVVDDEIAVVGDAAFGVFPRSAFPPFADDPRQVVESWKTLLDTGARVFLPAHGSAVSRECLLRDYEKRARHARQV